MKGDYCQKDCLQIYALYLKMVEENGEIFLNYKKL